MTMAGRGFPPARAYLRALGLVLTAVFLVASSSGVPGAASRVKEGDIAPLFAHEDMDGAMRTLQTHIGKDVILLDYWSIYCVSCVQEIPKLIELFEKYKAKDPKKGGLMCYGIDLDSFSQKRVKMFIDGLPYKIPYPIIVDREREIANAYQVGMLPTTVIIGKDGKIKDYHIGYKPGDEEELEKIIKGLLE